MLRSVSQYRVLKIIAGVILWMLPPFFVQGQILDPVSFSIKPESIPPQVEPRTPFTLTVAADIEKNWHLYSILNHPEAGPIPTTFSSAGDESIIAGDIKESKAERAFDPNFNTELGWHSGSAMFEVPVAVDALSGTEFRVDLQVHYQVCDDRSCLPPRKKIVSAMITLAESSRPSLEIDFSTGDFGQGTEVAKTAYPPGTNRMLTVIAALTVFILSFGVMAGFLKKAGKFSGRG